MRAPPESDCLDKTCVTPFELPVDVIIPQDRQAHPSPTHHIVKKLIPQQAMMYLSFSSRPAPSNRSSSSNRIISISESVRFIQGHTDGSIIVLVKVDVPLRMLIPLGVKGKRQIGLPVFSECGGSRGSWIERTRWEFFVRMVEFWLLQQPCQQNCSSALGRVLGNIHGHDPDLQFEKFVASLLDFIVYLVHLLLQRREKLSDVVVHDSR